MSAAPLTRPAAAGPARLSHLRRGSGEPLLLLHSLGGSNAQWNPVLDRLAAEREVIAVELPGFGSSPPLPAGVKPTPHNLAAQVLAFARGLGIERPPGVAGISLGSWVAIECARRGGAGSVVALCPAGFWRPPLGPRSNRGYRAVRLLRPLVPALLRIAPLRERALAISVRDPGRVPFDDAVAVLRAYGGGVGYPESNREMRASAVGDLSGLDVPLTIAWAEHDRLLRTGPLPGGVLPDAVRQLTLPGCGHIPTWDDPALVTEVILEGTARVRADAPTSGW